MEVFKLFWEGFGIGVKHSWKQSPIINTLAIVVSIVFWVSVILGPKTFKGIIVKSLITSLILLPLNVYYHVSGKADAATKGAMEELESKLKK